jgi:putative glycerol-1-phosphate prenyltransferase
MRTPEAVHTAASAGASVVVVGNAIEKDPALIRDMAAAVHAGNQRSSEYVRS